MFVAEVPSREVPNNSLFLQAPIKDIVRNLNSAYAYYPPIASRSPPTFPMARKPQPGWWIYKEWASQLVVRISRLPPNARGFLSQTTGLSLSR